MINSAQILLKNIIIKNIKGSFIFLSSGFLALQYVYLSDQFCDRSVCFANIMLNSNMEVFFF